MLISDEYRQTNIEMFANKRTYGSYGSKWAQLFNELTIAMEAKTLLDYGCGRGTLGAALRALSPPYEVAEYDPAIPSKQDLPTPADMVVCTDVMEHVEPECLLDVLSHMKELARKGIVLVIATTEAKKHLPDGRNAHLIVEDADWWLPELMRHWRILAFRDMGEAFMFVGAARL